MINPENCELPEFDFSGDGDPERMFLQGDSDSVLTKLAEDCGWGEELRNRISGRMVKEGQQPDENASCYALRWAESRVKRKGKAPKQLENESR